MGLVDQIAVSAGILRDVDGRILIARRKGDRAFRGFWEFPGGKIAPNETPAEALHRELAEELGIVVSHCSHFMQLEHRYPDRHVCIDFFVVDGWQGAPAGLLGQALSWVSPEDLRESVLMPADAPVVRALRESSPERC